MFYVSNGNNPRSEFSSLTEAQKYADARNVVEITTSDSRIFNEDGNLNKDFYKYVNIGTIGRPEKINWVDSRSIAKKQNKKLGKTIEIVKENGEYILTLDGEEITDPDEASHWAQVC